MGLNLNDGLVQLKITQSVCGFVAICMTVLRLYIRRGRYWWDDAWAFISLLNLFVQFASAFMHVENPSDLSKVNRVAAYYLMACTFYTVIWAARLSILFSIIRIDPDPQIRRRLKWIAAIFIAAIVFFLAQLMWVCEPEPGWKDLRSPQCKLNKEVAICQLVSDIIADLLLITLPLRLIHGIKDKALRRRLIFIFSTSIVTTIVSLVHAAYIITGGGNKVLISALVEDCMSLTVANVPVTATALVRSLRKSDSTDGKDDDNSYDEAKDGPRFSSFRFRSRLTGALTTGAGRTTGRGGVTTGRGVTTTRGVRSVSESVGTDTDTGLMTTKSTYTMTDAEMGQTGSEPKGGAHYISVGSAQGEDQWQLESGAPRDNRIGDGAHYISVGSVRQDVSIPAPEVSRTFERPRDGRQPVIRIESFLPDRSRGDGGR